MVLYQVVLNNYIQAICIKYPSVYVFVVFCVFEIKWENTFSTGRLRNIHRVEYYIQNGVNIHRKTREKNFYGT